MIEDQGRDHLGRLERQVSQLRRDIYGEWETGDGDGIKAKVAKMEGTIQGVEQACTSLSQELEHEQRLRELEAARREGQTLLYRRAEKVLTLVTGGGVFMVITWVFRILTGQ